MDCSKSGEFKYVQADPEIMHTGRYTSVVLALIAAFAAFACSTSADEAISQSGGGASPGSNSRTGQEIFASTCAACHGANGEGQPNWHIPREDGTLPAPPLNGDGHTWHHGDGLLYRIVSEGGAFLEVPSVPNFKSVMPSFREQLSHDELVAVITYIKTFWIDKTSRGLSILESQALVSENDPFPPDRN